MARSLKADLLANKGLTLPMQVSAINAGWKPGNTDGNSKARQKGNKAARKAANEA